MSSYKETGHANIVANFADLVERVSTMPMVYDPAFAGIQLMALKSRAAEAEASLLEVTELESAFTERVNQRQILYDGLPKFAVKVIHVMAYCGASKELLKDARAANRKFRGERRDKNKEEDLTAQEGLHTAEQTAEAKRISVSQRSYDQKAIHFAMIAGFVQAMPDYSANEPELSREGVIAHRDLLINMNKDMAAMASSLFNAKYKRNQLLYGDDTGIYHLAIKVRQYLRSVLGHDDERYKEIMRLPFKKIR